MNLITLSKTLHEMFPTSKFFVCYIDVLNEELGPTQNIPV